MSGSDVIPRSLLGGTVLELQCDVPHLYPDTARFLQLFTLETGQPDIETADVDHNAAASSSG